VYYPTVFQADLLLNFHLNYVYYYFMSISFFIGGARSGKSISAENYTLNLGNNPFYMATCEILDEEMALRVKRHQQRRDKNWTTIVAPLDISGEIQKIGTRGPFLIDCLTLWLSNHLLNKNNLDEKIDELITTLINSKSDIVLVSNEVGTGIVPDNLLAREFRDNAGFMNQKVASVSDEVYWVVAGIQTQIK
ncbi:MAG: bifunctional adenosylcobinamide kinase/adenosylcobinamide-phosphate guanylyltransferase, partial [Pseudomonadota bacterium]|nr:bifunctional adenosylcobinamide kinase/adenosylcobinamide-phosphate guanylyltransferase [Pseudomonadota bacterium]